VRAATARGYAVEGIGKNERSEQIPMECKFTQLDCAKHQATLEYWEKVRSDYPQVIAPILINNAGTYIKKLFRETDFEMAVQSINDNFYTAFNMVKGMMSFFSNGTIVNIISTTALRGGEKKSVYGASKSAEANFFASLREEYRGQYRIMNIYPGPINTWSPNVEPGCIDSDQLANWIIETATLDQSFEIAECTILPFPEQPAGYR